MKDVVVDAEQVRSDPPLRKPQTQRAQPDRCCPVRTVDRDRARLSSQLRPLIQTGATIMDDLFRTASAGSKSEVNLPECLPGSVLRDCGDVFPLVRWVGFTGLEPVTFALSGRPGTLGSCRSRRKSVHRRPPVRAVNRRRCHPICLPAAHEAADDNVVAIRPLCRRLIWMTPMAWPGSP